MDPARAGKGQGSQDTALARPTRHLLDAVDTDPHGPENQDLGLPHSRSMTSAFGVRNSPATRSAEARSTTESRREP